MNVLKNVPFTFEGRAYDIRVLHDDKLINVVAFRDNHPANGFRHQVLLSKHLALDEALDHEIVEEVIEMARSDIRENRWERLLGRSATT